MSCDTYSVSARRNGDWKEAVLAFSQASDEGCLCTFPNNYQEPEALDADTVRKLAMLGTLVVLAHHGDLKDEYNYVPSDVPDWMRDRIYELLPVADEDEVTA